MELWEANNENLVIEDDPNLNNQIKQLRSEDSGYSVDTALDGEEGHFGDTEPYDAVVLDLGLPKVDGITVLEKWRKEKISGTNLNSQRTME